MATLLNKHKVGEVNLSAFGHEMVGKYSFWIRYDEFCNVARRYLPKFNFEETFATPKEGDGNTLEWYLPSGLKLGDKLCELDPSRYEVAIAIRNQLLSSISQAESDSGDMARQFLSVLKGSLSDDCADTFCTLTDDGQLRVGAWGIHLKPGRELQDVMRMQTSDNRVLTIHYAIGQGISSLSFASFVCRPDYVLQATDVPAVRAEEGYEFIGWSPEPVGHTVTANCTFTAMARKVEPSAGTGGDIPVVPDTTRKPGEDEIFNIDFRSTEGGTLQGRTHHEKPSGSRIEAAEIPTPIADEDYHFEEWDEQPEGHIVRGHHRFTAHFERNDRFNIDFSPTEGGTLQGRTHYEKPLDSSVDAAEVPIPMADEGYHFEEWDEQPEGHIVRGHHLFTAHFERNDLFNIDFRHTEGGTLRGSTHYDKPGGSRIEAAEIPTPMADEGYRFVGWNENPEGVIVRADHLYTAHFERVIDKPLSWWQRVAGRRGCLGTLLRWLLLGLLIMLLLMLLWCFLFGPCWRGDCGCNDDPTDPTQVDPTDTTRVDPTDTAQVDPNDTSRTVVRRPCDAQEMSGSNKPYTGIYDMGTASGQFLLEYNTGDIYPDHIRVYNGRTATGNPIWEYYGTTGADLTEKIPYNSEYVTVTVDPDPSDGTFWKFRVNCPQ